MLGQIHFLQLQSKDSAPGFCIGFSNLTMKLPYDTFVSSMPVMESGPGSKVESLKLISVAKISFTLQTRSSNLCHLLLIRNECQVLPRKKGIVKHTDEGPAGATHLCKATWKGVWVQKMEGFESNRSSTIIVHGCPEQQKALLEGIHRKVSLQKRYLDRDMNK